MLNAICPGFRSHVGSTLHVGMPPAETGTYCRCARSPVRSPETSKYIGLPNLAYASSEGAGASGTLGVPEAPRNHFLPPLVLCEVGIGNCITTVWS